MHLYETIESRCLEILALDGQFARSFAFQLDIVRKESIDKWQWEIVDAYIDIDTISHACQNIKLDYLIDGQLARHAHITQIVGCQSVEKQCICLVVTYMETRDISAEISKQTSW